MAEASSFIDTLKDLRSHIDEARKRVFQVLISGVIIFIGCLYFNHQILQFLEYPFTQISNFPLTISSPIDILSVISKAALMITLLLIMPIANYHLLVFMMPGLLPHERTIAIVGFIFVPVLVLALIAFVYFILFPIMLLNLFNLTVQNAAFGWEFPAYISLLLRTIFITTILFPVPLGIYFLMPRPLTRIKIKTLLLILFIVSAIVTPGGMIFADVALTILFIAVLLLYMLIIKILQRFINPKRAHL